MDSVKNILHRNKEHHTEGAHGDNTHTQYPSEYPVENPTPREGTHHHHHSGEAAAAAGAGAYEAEKHHHHDRHEGALGHEHHQTATAGVHDASAATTAPAPVTRSSAELGAGATASAPDDVRPAAEVGNNFPGTNPHPDHSALGTMSGKGLAFSGRE